MTKQEITDLITADDKLRYLSAQAYGSFTREERELLREVVIEAGKSYADYQQTMISLFPKTVVPKLATWRKE